MRITYQLPKDALSAFIEDGRLMFYSGAVSYDFGFIANLPGGVWKIERQDKKTVTIKKEKV